MVRPIVRDRIFLARKAALATEDDLAVGLDLLDTLKAHREDCVGLAANMIGEEKRIIAFVDGDGDTVLYNPVLVKKAEPYEAEEGCLSLTGTRKTTRYRKIAVRYQNAKGETKQRTFTGFTAEIVQHELDHCEGILI